MWPWFARWTLHTKTLGRIAEIFVFVLESVWGVLYLESCFWHSTVLIIWDWFIICSFPSCNTRSNIEIAFRLFTMHDGGQWSFSVKIHLFHLHVVDDMFVHSLSTCEIWTKAGTHITKLDTMGKMKRKVPCWSMVSEGTFFSLEMMSDIPNICLYCTKNGQNGTGRTDDRHIMDWHTWIYLKNRLAEIWVSYDVICF